MSTSSSSSSSDSARENAEPSFLQKVKDNVAHLIQGHAPPNQLSLHLISLPCYTHSVAHQRLTHHYCHRYAEDIWQCVMWDGSDSHSRLIGVEYVIGEKTFKTLPEEEKKMWHSHHQEIRGGNTIAPALGSIAEHSVMTELANTYGKAIHFWSSHDALPYGPPKLIMTLCTQEKQAQLQDEVIWKAKDTGSGISSEQRSKERQDIQYNERLEGADQWDRGGELYEFVLVPVKHSAEIVSKYGGVRNEHRDQPL